MIESYVKIWEEEVSIPTYETGEPEKNPMFFEKRVYQGSSGAVYPNPIIEKIYDDKTEKKYNAVFLENEYIKLMVLPQLGGRIQMAFDKIGDRHFIYYNEVIKPALVGLCGPWISGGIEFNWPQHHRPSTFEPVDFSITENKDGSKTIWVNEIEKMFRTKGMAGFTLYPGKAYLEVKVKLFNRTPVPQTFLWWANPAVKVNDHYQSIFPPDVHAVFDHGKRDVTTFPLATGEYYKVDYSTGTDISRYKNIPVPTSYMAIHSEFDFIGGYEHDTQAGLLHVASHHISPGKKQWTWGNGDFGKAWDRNLTDENGPYIELMTGVFTDNQPDFSWLMPYEEKSFTQYFLPYRELGMISNANKDLLLHFSTAKDFLHVKLFATSSWQNLLLTVYSGNKKIHHQQFDICPQHIYNNKIAISSSINKDDLVVIINNSNGEEVLKYQPAPASEENIPEPAKAPLAPADILTNENLYLTGMHLEQYRHATFNPVDYYQEALKRDAGDVRNNNALGLWNLRRGKLLESEVFFRKAIETLTKRNSNPYDGEAFYNLGLCLQWQHRDKEAYANYYKATWNYSMQPNSYFALAQLDCKAKKYESALHHVQKAIEVNAGNIKALALRITLLRKLNLFSQALQHCDEAILQDEFNLAVYFEKSRLLILTHNTETASQVLKTAFKLSRGAANNFIEYAIDFSAAGLYEEAIEWLAYFINQNSAAPGPMLLYCLGWNYDLYGDKVNAKKYFLQAAGMPADYCFPNKVEEIFMLEKALEYNPGDSKAHYYLGCLWYDKRQYTDAINCWEQSIALDNTFPASYRNLGIAFFNKQGDAQKALTYFEKAFDLNQQDARILMELHYLYKRLNIPGEDRLAFLEKHLELVLMRDDLYLERIILYNILGKINTAFDLLMQRKFHPWEGGEGKVSDQYKSCLIQLAREKIDEKSFEAALLYLQQAQVYPPNLGEGKLAGTQENEIFYWMGVAYDASENHETAISFFEKAARGSNKPSAALFYNDPQPEAIFYRGLAWEKLNNAAKASDIFNGLIEYGETHFYDEMTLDYFAVSLPDLFIFEDDLDKRNKLHCTYMLALGNLGKRNIARSRSFFDEVLTLDVMHAGARYHEKLIPLFEPQMAGS